MGQVMSYGLTQSDVDDLIEYCNGAFTQIQIEVLYRRFRSLDRARKGFISAEEFLGIPELSINPLAQRLVRMFESVNFREFVKVLSAFSPKASRADKIAFMFQVYDVDGDGVVTKDDMHIVLRQLAGNTLSDHDLQQLINKTLEQAGCPEGLNLKAFSQALADSDISSMQVDVPTIL